MSGLESLLDSDGMLFACAAATTVMALLAVWHAVLAPAPASARLKNLTKIANTMRTERTSGRGNKGRGDFRQSSVSFIRHVVIRFRLMRGRHIEKIAVKLARAGRRSKDAVIIYHFAKAFVPVSIVVAGLIFLGIKGGPAGIKSTRDYMILAGAAIAGLFGTDLWVKNVGDKRIAKLALALPDALDLLVICAEAGLSLDSAIKRVGTEIAPTSLEMADELTLTGIELSFLPDRSRALQNLVTRTGMAKLRALVNSLVQSERFGTPLANSLRVLSAEFREERMMKAEEKAAKLPAIMTVPMIMFILPALFMVIIGPAALHIMDALSDH
jgi:tight adherence protein C